MVAFLYQKGRQRIGHGADPLVVLIDAIANSWFEGHLEGANGDGH